MTESADKRRSRAVWKWRLRSALRTLRYLPADALDGALRRREPIVPPRRKMFMGGREFRAVGDSLLRQFVAYGNLMPNHSVLDVGCGIGRAAVPLTEFLSKTAAYRGFDIVADGIDWCAENITNRHPNFLFEHADVFNGVYNPTGKLDAASYRFPYGNDTFDFAFATSVFTHMLPAEVERYAGELSRVLRPTGKCFLTYFLLTEQSRLMIESGRSAIDFRSLDGVSMSTSAASPEQAVAYEESFVRSVVAGSGMHVETPVRYGVWAGGDTLDSFQDIVVASKP